MATDWIWVKTCQGTVHSKFHLWATLPVAPGKLKERVSHKEWISCRLCQPHSLQYFSAQTATVPQLGRLIASIYSRTPFKWLVSTNDSKILEARTRPKAWLHQSILIALVKSFNMSPWTLWYSPIKTLETKLTDHFEWSDRDIDGYIRYPIGPAEIWCKKLLKHFSAHEKLRAKVQGPSSHESKSYCGCTYPASFVPPEHWSQATGPSQGKSIKSCYSSRLSQPGSPLLPCSQCWSYAQIGYGRPPQNWHGIKGPAIINLKSLTTLKVSPSKVHFASFYRDKQVENKIGWHLHQIILGLVVDGWFLRSILQALPEPQVSLQNTANQSYDNSWESGTC